MQQGGKRSGAGRKKGSNIYKESTKLLRVPESLIDPIKQQLKTYAQNLQIKDENLHYPCENPTLSLHPLYSHTVSAGFPTPADDHVERVLDLNQHLISNPVSTFFLRVSGDSMVNAHIQEDDILVVDKSIAPKNNDIVIAVIHGELTVKRLILNKSGLVALKPENDNYPIITVSSPEDLVIWGIVTSVIHKFN